MKHDFEIVDQGPSGLMNFGKRRCKNCGKTQTKHQEQSWGRVTGYNWSPLIGKCPGKQDINDKEE